jgi:hypothetical protein
MVIDDSEDDMMYHIFNSRDVNYTTLVNPSPASSTKDNVQKEIPPDLTEIGIYHLNRDRILIPDWNNFPKQGLKNLVKMLNSPTGFSPPEKKQCFKSVIDNNPHWMDWKDVAGIRYLNGKWYYNPHCNSVCVKNHASLPARNRVRSGLQCYNPRCTGVPTYLWQKNQKLYCTVECCDGYQEWSDAANKEVSFFYPLSPTHCYPEIGSMVGVMVSLSLKNLC